MKNGVLIFFICLTLLVFCPIGLAAEKIYHLDSGDVIEISVWKDPELSRNLVVPPDGIISFPLIGSIDVTHLTVSELKKVVTQKLSEFIPDATVTIMLIEINSLKAYVIGKVNNPGEFTINLETNVMQILSMAGGLNPFASKGSINIIRQSDNRIIKIPFDYGKIEKGKNLETNVMQILSMAGGLNPFASKGNVNIIRQQGNRIMKIPFDYGKVEKGKNLEQNILLQSGDVVVVP